MAVAFYDLGTSYTTIPNLTASNLNTWKTIYSASIIWDRYDYSISFHRDAGSRFSLTITPNTEILTYGHYYVVSAICGTGGLYDGTTSSYKATSATGSCKIYIQ